jgi:PhnB protein
MAKKSAKKVAKRKPVKKAAAKKANAKPLAKPIQRSNVINPYLTFNGTCEAAFNFYKSVFGGKFPYIGKFKDMPPVEGKPVPASEGEKIMHVSLPIGKESILMGSDSSDAFGQATVVGNNFSISVNAFNEKEADRLYKGLSAGGRATMPMSKTFWGSYFGMLTDKFGIQWMVSVEEKKAK